MNRKYHGGGVFFLSWSTAKQKGIRLNSVLYVSWICRFFRVFLYHHRSAVLLFVGEYVTCFFLPDGVFLPCITSIIDPPLGSMRLA